MSILSLCSRKRHFFKARWAFFSAARASLVGGRVAISSPSCVLRRPRNESSSVPFLRSISALTFGSSR
eukprot:7271093-Alexandrium_andersonii.AAC.1